MVDILHTEWSNGWGGQEMRIFLDARVLTEMGHKVTILTVPESGLGQKAGEAGLRVIETAMPHAFSLPALRGMVRLMRKERFDVVNTHSSVDSWLASMAARIARTPVLVRSRHLSVPLKTHPFNFVYKMPDGFVTTAEMIRRRMIEVNGMDPERVISIPTGVDLDRFDPTLDPSPVRRELGIPEGAPVVIMVAVLRSWKRHEVLLDAAARLVKSRPDLRVVIAGEGPRRTKIEARIVDLGLGENVILTGHRTDVPELLAASTAAVLTSESSEGVPQSVLQAQAMARPVVGTTAGGIPEVIEDGQTGLLVPPNDPKALAAALGRILDDPALAETLGKNARAMVEDKHSKEAMARTTLDFYERLRAAKKARR